MRRNGSCTQTESDKRAPRESEIANYPSSNMHAPPSQVSSAFHAVPHNSRIIAPLSLNSAAVHPRHHSAHNKSKWLIWHGTPA